MSRILKKIATDFTDKDGLKKDTKRNYCHGYHGKVRILFERTRRVAAKIGHGYHG